ncbi:hypothetical protein [Frankia sp. Cppng1_Ct_nod]|uniref:hypothetical protein n=1 Tax=Frankia sp. Cppng1_Ct_nod TaxID=2897162 RepID=UPI002025107F|nr:hypothetical protein [Frankia sp. Cppng1_Ct_nod]
MIRRHPGRVLGVLAVLDLLLLALFYPGRHDGDGAWYYLSAIGWIGFMIGVLATVVLAAYAGVLALGGRSRAS